MNRTDKAKLLHSIAAGAVSITSIAERPVFKYVDFEAADTSATGYYFSDTRQPVPASEIDRRLSDNHQKKCVIFGDLEAVQA